MRTIYYLVAVSAEKEQEFLNALVGLVLICYKDYEEIMYEKGFAKED
ncbi:MAG: hypothetical protein PHV87_04075 [Bacilli bacterium]|nr:hypothetical protein [Bacilli bacterium]